VFIFTWQILPLHLRGNEFFCLVLSARTQSRSISVAKAVAAVEDGVEKKRLALLAQSEDLGEARKALESAANIARGLWLTFLSLVVYLIIAVGSVTHRNLFLETPVRLPLLNAELPLVAFFWVAPLMLLVFHGYLLLNLKFLGDNVRHYFRLVDETKLDAAAKETLFLQLPNFMMVQLLRERRTSPWTLMGYALHGVVILTIVLGPVMALLFLQMRFLPYHALPVTMVQRFAIVADMILILYFWPGIVGEPATRRIRAYRLTMYGAMFLVVLFSGFVATFPGEWNYGSALVRKSGMADFLLRGPYNEVSGDRLSWFSDTLSLSDEDFVDIDDDKLEKTDVTVWLRGRDLTEANLARTDLRKADFSGANLEKAIFRGARLDHAVFDMPTRQPFDDRPTVTTPTDLLRADFSNSKLAKASFNGARLQGAIFWNAELENASFENSVLDGASFVNAKLAKANFRRASMRGAFFKSSDLNEADFTNATLIGTAIVSSQLKNARLAGVWLDASAVVSTNVFGVIEQKPAQDAWLENVIERKPPPDPDWGSTLVHDLKSEDKPLIVGGDDADFKVAGGKSPVQPDQKEASAAGIPLAKNLEITGRAVGISDGAPSEALLQSWKRRTKQLVKLVCLDPEYGATMFLIASRIAQQDDAVNAGRKKKNQLLFGPFNGTASAFLLNEPDCLSALKIKEVPEKDAVRDYLKTLKMENFDPAFSAELRQSLVDAKNAAETAAAAARADADSVRRKGEMSAAP
jgi:uncharacterized protein YjbI with pentapeptide repeats